jgi:hypothetical protein
MAPSDAAAGDASLWQAVDALLGRAPSDEDVQSHRLEVLAARRLRALGKPIAEDFLRAERLAAVGQLTAPLLLERVRDAYDGPLLVLKGPETAGLYPDPALRRFGDVDVLAGDAAEAHARLLEAGFFPVGDPELYVDIHHLRPLASGKLPLAVEVHSRPKWLDGRSGPDVGELLAAAGPSTVVDGLLAPAPAQHAVLLAVHSWAHEPLRRLRDIVDVAAARAVSDPGEVAAVADAWGVSRLWHVTSAAVDAVLFGAPEPWALRLWAQNLSRVRERTVFEHHVQRWLSDFAALPFTAAARGLPRTFADEILPEGDEGWRAKVARTGLAVRNASRRRSDHRRALEQQPHARPSRGDRIEPGEPETPSSPYSPIG